MQVVINPELIMMKIESEKKKEDRSLSWVRTFFADMPYSTAKDAMWILYISPPEMKFNSHPTKTS
jgi:hypothetical protein